MRIARLITVAILALGLASEGQAVTVGMRDTFETGPELWRTASLLGTVADNGPSAPGSSALLMDADGFGALGRLVGRNESQWTGDFSGAGVTAISLDLNNTGATDLTIRLSFRGSTIASDTYTTDGFSLAAGSGWQTAVFDVRASGLDDVLGNDAASALTNIAEMRIVHSPNGGFGGSLNSDGGVPDVVATLHVDNITAIPEPSTALLLVGGLLGLAAARSDPQQAPRR